MPSVTARLSAGLDVAVEHLPLAFVPLVVSLLDVTKLGAVVAFDGVHVGARLTLPASVLSVWSFVAVPNDGAAVDAGIPPGALAEPRALAAVAAGLLVVTALSAGYFGALRNALAGEPYRFARNARRYFVPFLALSLLPAIGLLPVGLGALAPSPIGVVVVAIPLFLLAAYLFYAAPYLLVLRGTDLRSALAASAGLAVEGGPYLSYALGFAGVVLAVSPIATLFVTTVPVVGPAAGLPAGAVVGLAGNAATMRFVADVDPETSPLDPPADRSAV